MLFLNSDLLMIIFSACILSGKVIPSVQLKRNVNISAMFQLLGSQCDVTILFHSLLIKSWSLHGLNFGHCLVRRNLIRVFELCTLILVDLIFPGSLHSGFWVECSWWGQRCVCGSALSVVVTGLALLLTLAALSMYHGYGFVQYDRLEDVQAALDGEKGRLYKGYRLGKETAPHSPDPSMRSGERVLLF